MNGTSWQLSESGLARWSRRLAALTLLSVGWTLGALALVTLGPILAIADLLTRASWARLRALLAVQAVLTCEGLGLVVAAWTWLTQPFASGRWIERNRALQLSWVKVLFRALCLIYGTKLVVEEAGVGADSREERPLIVLSRHTSLVDTLLPMLLLEGRPLRYVLKRELLWDPCLDVVGQRLPNAFVQRGGNTEAEVRKLGALARDLNPGEGVVIFPEGTRYTPAKRDQVLEALKRKGDAETRSRAEGLRHLLPPRVAGAEALLAACPEADVLVLAHTGLEGAQSLASFWRGHLIGREIRVRLERIPADQVPRSREGVERFLWETWRGMDAWLADDPDLPLDPKAWPNRARSTSRWGGGRGTPGRSGERSGTLPAPPECAK